MAIAVNFECQLSITRGYKIYTEIPTGPPNNKNIVKRLSRKNVQLHIEENPGSQPPFSISHPQQIPRLIFETLGGSNTLLYDHDNCSFPRHYIATHAHFRR